MKLRSESGEFRFTPRKALRRVSRGVRAVLLACWFGLLARFSTNTIVDPDSSLAVSMTSFGARLRRVHLAIESIARGSRLPGRIVLWVDAEDIDSVAHLPALERLVARGLEIRVGERRFRAHNKYYNFVASGEPGELVTADDDIFYPGNWLNSLWEAFEQGGSRHLTAHWVKQPSLRGHEFLPYNTWRSVKHSRATLGGISMGVAGVLIPRELQVVLANHAVEFLERSPLADDIWISWCALSSRIPVRQCSARAAAPLVVPGTQGVQLASSNVVGRQNDSQIASTYSSDDRELLARCLVS